MEAEESRPASQEDMTAAATAPMPNTETAGGVKCCRASGRIRLVWFRWWGVGSP